jgi:hypothetical protein
MSSILYSGIARLKMASWRAVMTSTSTQRNNSDLPYDALLFSMLTHSRG